MTKKKKLSELEKRISALEASINLLISRETSKESCEKSQLSYEEVISEWLNGTESKATR